MNKLVCWQDALHCHGSNSFVVTLVPSGAANIPGGCCSHAAFPASCAGFCTCSAGHHWPPRERRAAMAGLCAAAGLQTRVARLCWAPTTPADECARSANLLSSFL